MKRRITIIILLTICLSLTACAKKASAQIVATTRPVYEFTVALCDGTDFSVTQLITENISCLHDYTLQTSQMQAIESAEHIVISGAGLEAFLEDVLQDTDKIIDASAGVPLLSIGDHHEHHGDHAHHEDDPHIWLSPANAKIMANNICSELTFAYPQHAQVFSANLHALNAKLDKLQQHADAVLSGITARKIITFHDGFSYMADALDLEILHAIEEESGSEASAAELIQLIDTVNTHKLNVIFTETNGSCSAADIISRETGARIFQLDMCISCDSYINAMYQNINTLREALE